MPKKPPKNSYFYFMLDFKDRQAQKGRNLTLPQAAHEASDEWSAMGPEERRPYEMRAKQGKGEAKIKKYTTTGHDIELVLKREEDEQASKAAMHQAIENIVKSSPYPPDLEFCVGFVNYYCFCTSLNKYLPAEISIVRFSLGTGVDFDDMFHVILDTGSLPIGYRLVALKQSEETHGIPVPPHEDTDLSEKNIRKVLESMLDFLRKNSSPDAALPPVYFEPANMDIAKDVFKNLILDYGDNFMPQIKIYSLLHLFHQLRINAKKDIFPITVAQAELEKDVYDYVQGISCEYHNVTDKYQYCSLSHTIRKIYVICDYTNPVYDIQLVAGRHVPKNACAERLLHFEQDEAAALPPRRPVESDSDSEDEVSPSPSRPSLPSSLPSPLPSPLPSSTPKEAPAKPLRLPTSKSYAQTYAEPTKVSNPQSENYKNDFPALGGGGADNRPRPTAIGRGRGRILQNNK